MQPALHRYAIPAGVAQKGVARKMRSRREILRGFSAGVAAAAIPASAIAETEDIYNCRHHANNLAEAMKTKHGGVWRISIDKDFVLISKTLVSPSRPALATPG